MKSLLVSTLCLLTTISICGCTSWTLDETCSKPSLERQFGHVIIESFTVSDATVTETAEALNALIKKKHGVSILLHWGEVDGALIPELSGPDLDLGPDVEMPEAQVLAAKKGEQRRKEYYALRLTIAEKNIPLPTLVRRIACIADLSVSTYPKAISLADRYKSDNRTVGPHSIRFHRILPRYAWVFEQPMVFFEKRGILFGTDHYGVPEKVAFDKETNTLIFFTMWDKEKIDKMTKLIEPLLDGPAEHLWEANKNGDQNLVP